MHGAHAQSLEIVQRLTLYAGRGRCWRPPTSSPRTAIRSPSVGRVVTVYETPGHTFGTASYGYTVRDGGNTYRAVTVGGLGLNRIENVAQVEAYVVSVERLQAMAADLADPISVSLTVHPPAADMFPLADKLGARKAGEPNPFIDRAILQAQLAQLLKNGKERLAIEKAKVAGGK
jgi:metallo-beta-lactamase class B